METDLSKDIRWTIRSILYSSSGEGVAAFDAGGKKFEFWLSEKEWFRMKVVMQCAASKSHIAGTLRTKSGADLVFVADPKICTEFLGTSSKNRSVVYAKPDDPSDAIDISWRELLTQYNNQKENPHGLLRAAELYAPNENCYRDLYRNLAKAIGWDNFFILSAGWGLIRADFLIPPYNVTFSKQVKGKKPWVWRDFGDNQRIWLDFNQLRDTNIAKDEPVHFFGGRDYLPTFYRLAANCPGRKIIHHKGKIIEEGGFCYDEYEGREKSRTWHYRAAMDFLDEQRYVR